MKEEEILREHLVELLASRNAHASFEAAVKDVPARLRGVTPRGLPYSPWQLLEHIRIAQWDILQFSRNPKHVSPSWPEGYWPKQAAPPSAAAWSRSVRQVRADLTSMARLAKSSQNNLFRKIPHGGGQTLLREILLVADHNAYHVGQLVLLRRLLDAWK